MKKLGLISGKKSKRIFLFPEHVKTLASSNILVNLPKGYGKNLGIDDNQYLSAGAKVLKDSKNVILASDIVCKVDAFDKSEISAMDGKTAITMANYLANVDMLYEMLKNNVKGYAWNALSEKGQYIFFPELEKIKGRHAALQIEWALANKGLGVSAANAKGNVKPKILILNATWAAHEAICSLLAHNMDVTLLDNDLKYCQELKSSDEIKKILSIYKGHLDIADSKFETMVKLFPQHNGFIYTSVDPFNKTKPRITTEMAKSMPAGSILIDASCENGYGFQFQKKFVPETIKLDSVGNVNYSCIKDITDLYPYASSQVIANNSLKLLKDLANDKTDDFADILICKDGKVLNSEINKQLKLY